MHSYSNSLLSIAMICSFSWGYHFHLLFHNKVVLIDPLIRLNQMEGKRNHFPIDCCPNGIVDSID